MIADKSGEKARKLPNGTVDQAMRYVRAKKITNSRRRTKVRNPLVGVVAELPVVSTLWPFGATEAFPGAGSFGSFCTMRVFISAPRDRYASQNSRADDIATYSEPVIQ
jgi:hypothetical protein